MALNTHKPEQNPPSRTRKSPNSVQYRWDFVIYLCLVTVHFSESMLDSASSGAQKLGVQYDDSKSVLEVSSPRFQGRL